MTGKKQVHERPGAQHNHALQYALLGEADLIRRGVSQAAVVSLAPFGVGQHRIYMLYIARKPSAIFRPLLLDDLKQFLVSRLKLLLIGVLLHLHQAVVVGRLCRLHLYIFYQLIVLRALLRIGQLAIRNLQGMEHGMTPLRFPQIDKFHKVDVCLADVLLRCGARHGEQPIEVGEVVATAHEDDIFVRLLAHIRALFDALAMLADHANEAA